MTHYEFSNAEYIRFHDLWIGKQKCKTLDIQGTVDSLVEDLCFLYVSTVIEFCTKFKQSK